MEVEYGVVPLAVDDLENPKQFGSNDFGGTSASQCLCSKSGTKGPEDGSTVIRSEDDLTSKFFQIFTPEQLETLETYSRQVDESDGFDVDDFPKLAMCGKVTPVDLDNFLADDGIPCAKKALKKYNKKKNAQFEFLRVDKVNAQSVRGIKYYITFQAKDTSVADGPTKSFQALVLWGIPESGKSPIEVLFCRLKGSPN